jgi:hypothetical protein
MDFKSLISKIEAIDGRVETPKSPELPKAIKLDEDAEMRVLSGTSTILAESALMEKKLTKDEKDKKEEVVKSMKKDKAGFKERYGKDGEKVMHATATKIAKKKNESIDIDSQTVVEEAINDIIDLSISEERTKSVKDNFYKKFDQMVQEAKKKKPDANKDGIPDYAQDGKGANDLGKGKKSAAKDADKGEDKKETKGLSAKQKKLPPGLQKAIANKKGKKKIAESVERKMGFRDMMKLVVESGGQQQIDAVDQELFKWAMKVARKKLGEGTEAEIYAGLTYERMGGRFEMYDVLAEGKK